MLFILSVLYNTCLYQGCLIGAMEVYMVIDEIVVTRVWFSLLLLQYAPRSIDLRLILLAS